MADFVSNALAPAITSNEAPVAYRHPDYERLAAQWQRCRDVASGADAVKKQRTRYLPPLAEQEGLAYEAYLQRAVFYNATWRTIAGFVGMLFNKPPQVVVPPAVEPYLDDVALADEPLQVFVQELAEECFTVGRCGVLVDYPQAPDGALTVAQRERLNLRPTLARYVAERIINWKTDVIANARVLTMVVLTEDAALPVDEFRTKLETRYRVLDLVDVNGQRAYRQRLFRINERTRAQEQVGPDVIPLLDGKPLESIPFTFFGVDSITTDVDAPPLIDLVDMNLAHYRVSADYENANHMTGVPTPVVTGYVPASPTEVLYVGSTSAWVFPDPSTRAFYLEYSGSGGALAENLDRKEKQMATIGARLLAGDPSMAETATTAAIHSAGESSILAAVAQVLSLGMTRALTTFAAWAGASGEVKFEINRDFFPAPMDPATLAALVTAWQAGAISKQVLFDNLQKADMVPQDATFEDEEAAIKANPPPTVAPAAAPQQA